MKRLIVAVSLALAAVIASAQTNIQVQTHKVVALNEQFNVTFIIEGESRTTDFTWSPGEDFTLLWGPQQGRSSSVQIINGKTTKSVQTTYTYVLHPGKVGKFTLPKASAKVKGNTIWSEAVTIEVVSGGNSSSSSSAQQHQAQAQPQGTVAADDIFLSLELSRRNVVVGEPITATLKLYQKVNVSGFESADFPSFDGFWSQETEAPTNIEFARETYDGQIYNAALLRRYILIPQHQGELKIDPAELVCLINVRVSSGGSSIFDGFFDDYRTVRKRVTSQPVSVHVKPLPAGAPASFGGGVGDFSISAGVSRDSLKTHEAASLLITVSGRGNISLLEAPKVNFPPDVEVYDTKITDRLDKGGISGSRTYEYPFIPRSHGDFVIEPVQYSYYDVNTQRYVTLQTEPLEITVARGNEADNAGVVMAGPGKTDVRNLSKDIRFISTKDPGLVSKGVFFVGSVLFWLLSGLLVVLAAVMWAVFRKVAARRADVVGTRNRKATKMALKRLHLASTFLKQDLYTAFYEELHKALLGFISDKLNMPLAQISRDRIEEALAENNVSADLASRFTGVLDACEFARYSPSAGHDAMAAHYNEAVEVISSIDSNMKSKKNMAGGAVVAVLVLMMLPSGAYAQQIGYADSLWNAANAAYADGRWEDAVSDYEKISSLGLESASLYCNIGDAFYKGGNVPAAVLNYERALKLDPSYSDARYNLELMNALIQDRIDPVPEFILKTWAKKACWIMDSDAWAVAFIVFLAFALAMTLLFLLAPSVAGRRTGFYTGILMIVLMVLSLSFALWQKNDYISADDAIVMRPVAAVKSSPAAGSASDLFVLHEGTKVKVLDTVGSWNNIELADGRQGWIASSDIELI